MPSVFGPRYLVDLRSLSPELRARAATIVREIEANPEPDGIFKRQAPPPFKPGMIDVVSRGLTVRYSLDADSLRFYRVQVVDP